MALLAGRVTIEHREILLKDRPEALYSISKKGTVPVLYIDSSAIIDESLDIMMWVIDKCALDWLEYDKKMQLEKIAITDSNFKYWLDRYKYHDRYPENPKKYYRKKCDDILSEYENQLNNTKYLLRDSISIADISIFPFIRQFANVDYQWFKNNYTKLTVWLEDICLSDLFIQIMEKYEIWNNKNDYAK